MVDKTRDSRSVEAKAFLVMAYRLPSRNRSSKEKTMQRSEEGRGIDRVQLPVTLSLSCGAIRTPLSCAFEFVVQLGHQVEDRDEYRHIQERTHDTNGQE